MFCVKCEKRAGDALFLCVPMSVGFVFICVPCFEETFPTLANRLKNHIQDWQDNFYQEKGESDG